MVVMDVWNSVFVVVVVDFVCDGNVVELDMSAECNHGS